MPALLLDDDFTQPASPLSNWVDNALPAYDANGEPTYLNSDGQLIEGIYLDLPNDVYHALPALSSSGLKKFMSSPAHYYRDYLSGIERKRTNTQRRTLDTGTHAHSLVLEPGGYYDQFFRDVIPSDYPDALHTATQIEEQLVALDLKKSGTKAEKIERLLEADPTAQVFDKIREDNCLKRGERGTTMLEGEEVECFGDKVPVDGQIWDDAHRAQETVRSHAEADAYIQYGLPEVTIIARDPITGLMLKVKFDWLRFDDEAVDLKTTRSTKPEEFKRQLLNLHYDLQQAFYCHVAKLAGIEIRSFVFVTVEFVEADICQPYELSDKLATRATKQVSEGLKQMKTCMEEDKWFGWSEDDCTMVIQ